MFYVFRFALIIEILLSNIVYETGSIVEFFSGHSPSTSYDNWISHVSEGIAEQDYNDYGPTWLDVQTNGFGSYRVIEEGSPTLDYWEDIFVNFRDGNLDIVNNLLVDSLDSFFYEVVS